MSTVLMFVVAVGAGYVLGAIPFAVIVAKRYGVNIFKEGSGNPGATNVKRVLGAQAGNTVFILDALKGFVAAAWPQILLMGNGWREELAIAGLMGAILGHSFSVFIQFRGGKGVATTIGGLLAVSPFAILLGIGVWLVTFYTTRYVSLASILMGLSLPLACLLLPGCKGAELAFLAVVAVLIVVRHKTNIMRLMNGTENRFTGKG